MAGGIATASPSGLQRLSGASIALHADVTALLYSRGRL